MTEPADHRNWLIRGAAAILTGERGASARYNVRALGSDIRVVNGRIAAIGRLQPAPGEAIINAQDCVVYPGWVNTHHHLFQSLLKGIPAGIDLPLTDWLATIPVPYRRHFDHERALRVAARVGLVELLLSGCTTVADHQYHYYPGMPYDASAAVFDEAAALGMRFVLCRGGQTRARTFGTPAPREAAPETLDTFLAGVERDVQRFHDPAPDAMRRVVSAITTPPWSAAPDELPVLAREARRLGIRLHSHLSETYDYVRYCREVHGCSPMEFVERHEWVGPDVWFAHMVHLGTAEIQRCAETGTGIAHCPQSNARLGSGIAPVPQMLAAGVPVSLAVDGAASNEAADMLSEAHACWLLHRARPGHNDNGLGGQSNAISVEDVVHIGTAGGAHVLGLPAIGTVAVGQAADLAVYRLDHPRFMGLHDTAIGPVASGGPPQLRALLVHGKRVVQDDQIPGIDLNALRHDAQQLVQHMCESPP